MMKNIVDLTGRKIMITGASSGIGRSAAVLLSFLGAALVLVGRNKEDLSKTESMLNGYGHQSLIFDLRNLTEIENLYSESLAYDGKKLTGLVYSAGISVTMPLRNLDYKLMDDVMKINYYAFIEMVKYYSLKKYAQGGSVVAVSSTAAKQAGKCQTVYAASKAAMDISVRTLSMELIKKGIRINSVLPGLTGTKMAMEWEHLSKGQLMGLGKPEDVANLIAFLLSDASSFMTGRNYFVDGGAF